MEFLDTAFLRDDEIYLDLARTADAIPERGWVPAYHFVIRRVADGNRVGQVDLRVGHNDGMRYGGHIGYVVDEDFRGHGYAARAVRLLLELARRHKMGYLYVTCDPENTASRKTCERAGGQMQEIVDLPPDHEMHKQGARRKCLYRFAL